MSDSINEQRCEHGKTYRHPLWNGPLGPPLSQIVGWCPGPSVITPPAPDEQPTIGGEFPCPLCRGMDHHERWCLTNLEDIVPAAPSVSTDTTDERRAALADLEHVMTLALLEIDDEDKAAAVEQFRGDMLALGVRADELDAAGLTEWRDD